MEPKIIKGGVAVDDRGVVTFNNSFDMSPIKRFYMLQNHQQGFVRAWHGHSKESKWIVATSGVAIASAWFMYYDRWHPKSDHPVKCRFWPGQSIAQVRRDVYEELVDAQIDVGSYDQFILDPGDYFSFPEPYRFTLHPNGDILYIPPGYANGHMNLVSGTRVMHFSDMSMEEVEEAKDDYRFNAGVHRWVWEVEER